MGSKRENSPNLNLIQQKFKKLPRYIILDTSILASNFMFLKNILSKSERLENPLIVPSLSVDGLQVLMLILKMDDDSSENESSDEKDSEFDFDLKSTDSNQSDSEGAESRNSNSDPSLNRQEIQRKLATFTNKYETRKLENTINWIDSENRSTVLKVEIQNQYLKYSANRNVPDEDFMDLSRLKQISRFIMKNYNNNHNLTTPEAVILVSENVNKDHVIQELFTRNPNYANVIVSINHFWKEYAILSDCNLQGKMSLEQMGMTG